MLLQWRMAWLFIAICGSSVLVGCEGGRDGGLVPVTGVVTFKGEPIGNINVMFEPLFDGRIAEGTSDAEGKFELKTLYPGDGVMPGEYKVSFKYISDTIPDMPGFVGGIEPEPSPIPERYADANESGFTATVEANAKNEFTFNLEE